MTFAPFQGPEAKALRAREFIAEIECLRDSFRESRPVRVLSLGDWGQKRICDFEWDAVDISVGIAVGDAIHSLRSALDILACDIARLNGHNEIFDVSFPIARSQQIFEDTLKKGWVQKLGQPIIEILTDLQPYAGGNEFLYNLHATDNAHKHRMPLISSITLSIVVPIDRDAILDAQEIEDQACAEVDFAFENGTPFGGQRVDSVLQEGVTKIFEIIETFKTAQLKAASTDDPIGN